MKRIELLLPEVEQVKINTDNQPSMQDLRQMFAYNHFWDAPKSILLYPKVSDKVHDVNGDYVANQVHTAEDALMNHSCSLAFVELLEKDSKLEKDSVGVKLRDDIGDETIDKINQ
jgi:5-methylcytosine-specific restriction enzyme subunit McrC